MSDRINKIIYTLLHDNNSQLNSTSLKKNLILLTFTTICLPVLLFAQEFNSSALSKSNLNNHSITNINPENKTTNSLFDLQFDYTLPVGGCAGITWTWTDFWVSKWQSDTVFIIDDSTGIITSHFFISGVTGIRGMSFDGTSVWVTNNTTSIYRVDTLTKAILSTITAPINARGIAYDSSANGGAGGLWIANYSTDITLIDLSGNVISSILASSHGLTAMYSIAFDPWTYGGPYIWAFDQGAGAGQNLVRISIATGAADAVHDVGLEIGGNGLAGGLAITGFANPGPHTIIGISQASPDHLFGLELGDYVLAAYDASVDSLFFNPPYLSIPSFMVSPINWEMESTNRGINVLDTINSTLTVGDSISTVFISDSTVTGISSLSSFPIYFPGSFTPVAQPGVNYEVTAIVNTGSQIDLESRNDTINYSFSITDTTMQRSQKRIGSLGIGNGIGGAIGLIYELPVSTFATSATFALENPAMGDSIKLELYDWNGASPNSLIASSANYIFTAADTQGVVLTLPLINAPIFLTSGTYVLAIREYNFNISLSYSNFNWRPFSTWIDALGNGWLPSENYNFKIIPFLNLNVWSENMVAVDEVGNTIFSVYPNPSSNQFVLDLPIAGNFNITITDVQGKIVYRKIINGQQQYIIHTNEWSNGLYITKVESSGKSYYTKVLVSH